MSRYHSWLTVDKHILFDNPVDTWKEKRLRNKIPMVFGEHSFSLNASVPRSK